MAKSKKFPAIIDHEKHEIILYKWFYEKSRHPKNTEFGMLVEYVKSFPTYTIRVREDIKKNPNQEHYNGLTYDYMKRYINKNEPEATRDVALKEFEDKLFISKCHSKSHRYPTIKKWFLEKYPEVAKFGIPESEIEDKKKKSLLKLNNADDFVEDDYNSERHAS